MNNQQTNQYVYIDNNGQTAFRYPFNLAILIYGGSLKVDAPCLTELVATVLKCGIEGTLPDEELAMLKDLYEIGMTDEQFAEAWAVTVEEAHGFRGRILRMLRNPWRKGIARRFFTEECWDREKDEFDIEFNEDDECDGDDEEEHLGHSPLQDQTFASYYAQRLLDPLFGFKKDRAFAPTLENRNNLSDILVRLYAETPKQKVDVRRATYANYVQILTQLIDALSDFPADQAYLWLEQEGLLGEESKPLHDLAEQIGYGREQLRQRIDALRKELHSQEMRNKIFCNINIQWEQ